MKQLLIAVYGMAATTLVIALNRLAGIDLITAAVCGVLLCMTGWQIHGSRAQARLCRGLRRNIADLGRANAGVKAELETTKKAMAEVTLALAKRSDAQEKKVVGELQIIEGLVREFASGIATKAKTVAPETEPAAARKHEARANYAATLTDPDMLEIIRRSLEENRVDLYLQPAVSLPQRKVRFYEALSRLRSEDGSVIMPAQYMRIAAPAGLMSVVDNLLLFRCIQVVRRLTYKRRDLAVFCNISAHTLRDEEFFPQFLEFMHHQRDVAGQIIFEFSEDTVLGAGPEQEANLRSLASLGFSLSMDQVTTLDIDFTRLSRLGFHYIKVPAQTLISGMSDAHAAVAAEDLKDLMARSGLSLIVERIEDEKTVVQLLEFNVDYGQGYLFGEPRPIREMAEVHDARATPLPSNVASFPPGLARRLAG